MLQVRSVPRNATVGYGATWTAKRGSRIAVIAAGYADGLPARRRRRPSATCIVAGKRCRIVGRISMDLLAVDVTDLPESAVRRGDLVTLIGGELDVDAVGAQAGTIGYEVLTSLGHRYHRIWKS